MQNVSGVAIVDKSGNLTDTISVRDLRGLSLFFACSFLCFSLSHSHHQHTRTHAGIGNNAARWKRLAMPVNAFKALVREEFAAQVCFSACHVVLILAFVLVQTPGQVLQVQMSDTLGKVLFLLIVSVPLFIVDCR